MNAEINELFEEGITRSRELADTADQAMNAIDAMAKEADELAQRVEQEGREVCRHMRELAARLGQAEGEVQTARGQAEGALEGLTTEALELKAGATELLERVRRSLDEVESRQGQLDAALDSRMGTAEQDFQELAQQAHEAQHEAEQQLHELAQAITTLRTGVETARAELEQKKDAWATASEALATGAHGHVQDVGNALMALLERQGGAIVSMTNAMVGHHNRAMDEVRSHFVEQAPQELEETLKPLEDALEHLGVDAAQQGTSLTTESRRLEHLAEQSRPVVESVRGALDGAAHVR